MPRSLAFLQWIRVLQQARRLNLQTLNKSPAPLPRKRARAAIPPVSDASIADSENPWAVNTVVIVGAGLAGLNAAYQLKKVGLSAQVFEAGDRAGGRVLSVTGAVGEGIVTDLGGELINSDHLDLRALADELGVTLLPRESANEGLEEVGYFFERSRRSETDIANALRPFVAQVTADSEKLDSDWDTWGPYFDNLPLTHYLDQHSATLPQDPDIRSFVEALVRVEFGVEPCDSSTLQLLYLLPVMDGVHAELLSANDEAWVIDGGSESLVKALCTKLDGHVHTQMALTCIEREGEDYALTFNNQQKVTARYVVLALPFTALRKVDIRVPLPESLQRFISEVNLGRNEKVVAGVHQRVWRSSEGFELESWNDQSVSLLWDSSLRELKTQTNGALTFFLSGDEAATTDSDIEQLGRRLIQEYDALLPGLAAHSNGLFVRSNWHTMAGIYGGYTNFKPGQYTGFASQWMYVESDDPDKVQNVHVDRLVFAGEHTSDEFYGFMNGAAQTGRLAAQWILHDISGTRCVDSGSNYPSVQTAQP